LCRFFSLCSAFVIAGVSLLLLEFTSFYGIVSARTVRHPLAALCAELMDENE
jgi:hypothetical protein